VELLKLEQAQKKKKNLQQIMQQKPWLEK